MLALQADRAARLWRGEVDRASHPRRNGNDGNYAAVLHAIRIPVLLPPLTGRPIRGRDCRGMPRRSRFELPGTLLHAIQRGMNRCAVFVDDVDREHYYELLCDARRVRIVVASKSALSRVREAHLSSEKDTHLATRTGRATAGGPRHD